MDNEIKKYLFDIQESINSIEHYLGDIKDFSLYKANKTFSQESNFDNPVFLALSSPLTSHIWYDGTTVRRYDGIMV